MKVDPFVVPIPRSLLENPDPQVGQFFNYLIRFLHDLWQRTGGGDDLIETTINQTITGNDANPGALAELFARREVETAVAPAPVQREFNPVSTTIDMQAAPFDFINAKRGARITLPTYGSVIVRNGDGSNVEIYANGKLINGQKLAVIRREQTSLYLQYFVEDDEWLVR